MTPPSFNVLVEEAGLQIAECDCPGPDIDGLFEDFERVMEEAQIAQDCEEFAGAPSVDPHYEEILLAQNTEVTIRYDRLGWYGVSGTLS